MTYRIIGVDRITGGNRQTDVDADCEKDALLWASEIGILTSRIRLLPPPPQIATMPAARIPPVLKSVRRKPKNSRGGVLVAGAIFLSVIWVCSGLFTGSSSSSSHSYTPSSPNPSFSSDKERLEWRSQNHLPMSDEDVKYEQSKIIDAYNKVKDSESPIGR